jgi:hypothetical protein
MGSLGSTTSVRARQMRRVLAGWQLSGLTLREFGERHGIPLSTLTWWRRVFRHAGDQEGNSTAVEKPVVFTEVPPPAKVSRIAAVVEIVLRSGDLVRVPAGADSETLQRVLQALQTTC